MKTLVSVDPKRVIPIGGSNPYLNHPGFYSQDCRLQLTVTRMGAWGAEGHGFSCLYTGGHCLPGDDCERRRKIDQDNDITDSLHQTMAGEAEKDLFGRD